MLISRKVTEVSEISHVNLRAGWKELTKPINRSNSSLVQDVAPRQIIYVAAKKFWFGTIELIENLFFHIANK